MKKIVIFLLILFAGINISFAATLPQPRTTTLVPIDKVVVVVNDSIITQSEIYEEIQMAKQQLQQTHTPMPAANELRSQIINGLIYKELQQQLLKRTGIEISDLELNQAINSIAKNNHMTLPQLKDNVEMSGMSFAKYRKQIREQIAFSRLQQQIVGSNIVITSQEVHDYLNSQKNSISGNSAFHLEDILIALPETPTPKQIQLTKEKADKILQQAKKGIDFRKLAAANSNGQEALKGGDLGWRKLAELPEIFVKHVTNMRIGQVSDVIQAPNGFHIIKLIGTRAGKSKLTADEVREQLYRRKFNEQLLMWLKKLRSQAYIKFV